MRRILRIWPLYYFYILICFIIYLLFSISYDSNQFWYYLFYSANIPFIIGGGLPLIGHFWSLGVEEQFYIFWPWVNKLKVRKIFLFSLLLIIIMIGLKTYLHLFKPGSLLESVINVTRFHCMAIGALLAIQFKKNNISLISIMTHWIPQTITWLVILLIMLNRFHIASFIDSEIVAVVTTFLIIGQISEKGIINLENKAMEFLGKISYGIYVWHILLIFLLSKVINEPTSFVTLNYLIVYGGVVSSTIILSYYSYKYLETPFLKLKSKKFTVVNSSGVRAK